MGSVGEQTFHRIPVLDLTQVESPETRQIFLAELREALVVVGFFYLSNPGKWVSRQVRQQFVEKSRAVCDLPLEKKMEIDMINSKHFLGYSRMGLERTAAKLDHREMFDFLSPHPPPKPSDPIFMNVQGPNQWPDESYVPGFRKALEDYLAAVGHLGRLMQELVAEALDLEPTTLDSFFSTPPRNKVSLLKYPEPAETSCPKDEYQGVGPHKDGGFLTYLLQATAHQGLEAQNKNGEWIEVLPIADTFVVNVGRSLESITRGVCTATTHRVSLRRENYLDSKGRSLGPRYSFPVFQTLKLDLSTEHLLSIEMPAHIAALVANEKIRSDAEAYFAKYHLQSPGMGIFTARLTSHPEVGRRWYPEYTQQALKGQKAFVA